MLLNYGGNGQDTLFLVLNTPKEAKIWGLDLQGKAIRKLENFY
jgi:hypothetical protein